MAKLIESLLRKIAILASLVIVVSFIVYASHQANGASQVQQQIVTPGQPVKTAAPGEGAAHRWLDDANNALVSPISSFAPGTTNSWAYRITDLIGGVLIWGVLLGIVARSLGLSDKRRRAQVAGKPSSASSASSGPKPSASNDPWADARF